MNDSSAVKDKATAVGRKIWSDFTAFTPGQKVVTITAVLALVIGGYLFSSWSSQPSYQPLFTNLAASDASAIVDKLQADHKSYKLSEGGTAILVPSSDVYALRLTMSSAGLPSSGQTGYSLLDKEGVTTSEFNQRIDYQRALEGELASTIGSIDGVINAQVHLAMPTEDVFSDGSEKTTAAVLLTVTPGVGLTTDQVRSVVNLVSSSVPGLTADQVTVSDSTGRVLAAAGSGITAADGTSTQDEETQAYDTQLSSSVQAMLDRVLGPGNAIVTVNAQLDFDSTTQNSRTYSYDKTVPPLSQSTTSESYGNGANPSTGGILGSSGQTASTIGGAASTTGAGNYLKTTNTQDNSVNTTDETRISAPGAVKQLGVSVVLDQATPGINPATIKSLVASAVNLDTARGDTLAVATLPFDTSAAQAAAAAATAAKKAAIAAASRAQLFSMIKTGGVVLAVALAVIITVVMSRRRKQDEPEPDEMPDDLESLLAVLNERAGSAGVPAEPAMRTLSPAESERTASQRQAVSELADEQPDDMARLLRTWLNTKES